MRVQSIIERSGGTEVEIGGKTYKFAPTDKDPRHIAEVEDEDHLARFLSIREGYRIAKKDQSVSTSSPTPVPTLTPTPSPVSGGTAAPAPQSAASPAPEATVAPAGMFDDIDSLTATIAPSVPDDLDSKTKADLIDFAKENKIEINDKLPKPAIVSQIRAARG